MVKVIVINDFVVFPGGGTSMAHFTAEVLVERGHDVTFVAGLGSASDQVAATYPIESLGLSDVRAQGKLAAAYNGIFRIAALRKLRQILKRFPPEDTQIVLHQWTRVLSPAVFEAVRDYRVLVYAHDYFLACPTGSLYRFDTDSLCKLRPLSAACVRCACDRESRLHKWVRVVRLVLQNALIRRMRRLGVIFVSQGQAVRYGRLFPASGRHHTLPNMPITAPVDQPADPTEVKLQALYVGRIVPEKGVEELARAARAAGIQCTFAGDGPSLKALSAAFPDHCWLGWRDRVEVAKLMRNADLLVVPSKWAETAGLVVVEALQQGTPALISRVVCVSVDLDGIPGVTIYDPLQPDALERALKQQAPSAVAPPRSRPTSAARSFDVARAEYGARLEAILASPTVSRS